MLGTMVPSSVEVGSNLVYFVEASVSLVKSVLTVFA